MEVSALAQKSKKTHLNLKGENLCFKDCRMIQKQKKLSLKIFSFCQNQLHSRYSKNALARAPSLAFLFGFYNQKSLEKEKGIRSKKKNLKKDQ